MSEINSQAKKIADQDKDHLIQTEFITTLKA